MGIGDQIRNSNTGAGKVASKDQAKSLVKKDETKDFFANAISRRLQNNLRIIDQMSEDRLTQGMKNALTNEALELLTEAYREGKGKFKFEHPELLK